MDTIDNMSLDNLKKELDALDARIKGQLANQNYEREMILTAVNDVYHALSNTRMAFTHIIQDMNEALESDDKKKVKLASIEKCLKRLEDLV